MFAVVVLIRKVFGKLLEALRSQMDHPDDAFHYISNALVVALLNAMKIMWMQMAVCVFLLKILF